MSDKCTEFRKAITINKAELDTIVDAFSMYVDKLEADLKAAQMETESEHEEHPRWREQCKQEQYKNEILRTDLEAAQMKIDIQGRMIAAMAEDIDPKIIGWNPAGSGTEIYETIDATIERYRKNATEAYDSDRKEQGE